MNSNSEDSEIVIGIDEAGRGPLAGPVAIGAVQLDPEKDFDELQNIDPNAISSQLQRLKKIKKTRNPKEVKSALNSLQAAANGNKNLMPYILNAVKQYVTLGEIADILRLEFGEHQ